MKKAISISIGSSSRDKEAVVNLLGEEVHISRVGTDGDMQAARQMYRDLDGKVDTFGLEEQTLVCLWTISGINS